MSKKRHLQHPGFTLIELMVIVAVLAILALITIPKMSAMIRKANEAGTKGHLGSARAAIRLYYMDNENTYPSDFNYLLQPGSKYLNGTIPLYTADHGTNPTVDNLLAFNPDTDSGTWGYVNTGSDAGFFWVQCTHWDTSNNPWTHY